MKEIHFLILYRADRRRELFNSSQKAKEGLFSHNHLPAFVALIPLQGTVGVLQSLMEFEISRGADSFIGTLLAAKYLE